MRRGLSLALALVAGLSAAFAADAPSIRLSVELPDNPTAGARLFVQKACVRCHSLGGEEARVGPDLGRIHLAGTVLDIAGAFWNHSPVMREKMQDLKIPAPSMTSGEMADLVAFLTAYRYYLTELGEPASPTDGQAVFVAKGCSRCHGGGDAWDKPGPSLDRYRGRFSPIFLAQAMWNHGPEMAKLMRGQSIPWPRFAGKEMANLLAFLQAGTGGPHSEPVYFEPGNPRRGRELFREKRCDSCHSVEDKGARGGPNLGARRRELIGSVASIAGVMWNHAQGMEAEFARRGVSPAKFSGVEMADIIAYLYFVNYAEIRGTPTRGARLFDERCSACHSMAGSGKVGPDLAAVPRLDDPIAIIAAMWNHAPKMEAESRRLGILWPRFQPGDTADLAAFLIQKRSEQRREAAPGER